MKCDNKYCERDALPQMVVCAEHATPDAIRMAMQRLVDIKIVNCLACGIKTRVDSEASKISWYCERCLELMYVEKKNADLKEQIKKIEAWFEEQHCTDGMPIYLMDQLASILAGDE